MPARKPIELGSRFSRLVVIAEASPAFNYKKDNIFRVLCKCDCGREKIIPEYKLRAKHTRSCGCLGIESSERNLPPPTHQKTKTTEYRSWQSMRSRCLYEHSDYFHHYGGRGITICKRWDNFENFLEDMGKKPAKNYSLERLDVNGNYEPSNCVWADEFAQCRNRRNNVKVEIDGKSMCVSEACEILGTHQSKIVRMVRRFNITHQKAVDLYHNSPKGYNFRDFQKILDDERQKDYEAGWRATWS